MRDDYVSWLAAAGYQDNTRSNQISYIARLEQYHGNLDDLITAGGYEDLISELSYSTADERMAKANPSRIPINGNIRNNLSSYKAAARLYHSFISGAIRGDDPAYEDTGDALLSTAPDLSDGQDKQRLSLERDMQKALRDNIALLEDGLTIIDDGIERQVLSGRIDILCRDSNGAMVVIELKQGGLARHRANPRLYGRPASRGRRPDDARHRRSA